jgi:cytochrome oxidase Cu insertion factor (SCO1/SenC/PrrC family)
MRNLVLAGLVVALAVPSAPSQPKREQKEEDFLKAKPAVGDVIPDLTVYSPDGKEVKTSDLRGHYTVLTFGCLT